MSEIIFITLPEEAVVEEPSDFWPLNRGDLPTPGWNPNGNHKPKPLLRPLRPDYVSYPDPPTNLPHPNYLDDFLAGKIDSSLQDESPPPRPSLNIHTENNPHLYQNMKLVPIVPLHQIKEAVTDYYKHTFQYPKLPKDKMGGTFISKLESQYPQLLHALGFDTGTTHLEKPITDQQRFYMHLGIFAHDLRATLFAVAHHAINPTRQPTSLLPTYKYHQLDPLHYILINTEFHKSPSREQLYDTLFQAVVAYLNYYTDYPKEVTPAIEAARAFTDPSHPRGGDLETWTTAMAWFFAGQFTAPTPLPQYSVANQTVLETTTAMLTFADTNMRLTGQPDQITRVRTKNGTKIIYTEFKTYDPLKAFLYQDGHNSDVAERNTALETEIFLRQCQLSLLMAYSLLPSVNFEVYCAGNLYRDNFIPETGKFTRKIPETKFDSIRIPQNVEWELNIEIITKTGETDIHTISFTSDQMQEALNWWKQYGDGYRAVFKQDYIAVAHGLMRPTFYKHGLRLP